jgi:hypothetical protein
LRGHNCHQKQPLKGQNRMMLCGGKEEGRRGVGWTREGGGGVSHKGEQRGEKGGEKEGVGGVVKN